MAWWDKLGPGIRVNAVARPLDGETFEWATILGGDVLITQIMGRFTVATAGASNVHLQHTADYATARVTALCALADVNGLAIGDMVSITGVPGDTLLVAVSAVKPGLTVPLMVPPGGVESVISAASGTAAIEWSLWYIPLDDAAYVTGT